MPPEGKELASGSPWTRFLPENSAIVWPSRYEGFGLPPLEAMASGAAVISSDTSSMPEIVGDGGLLIAPHDTEAWAVAMLKMLGDPELRQSYRERGLRRAAAFDWADFARQMVAVYERIPPRLGLAGSRF